MFVFFGKFDVYKQCTVFYGVYDKLIGIMPSFAIVWRESPIFAAFLQLTINADLIQNINGMGYKIA